MPPVVEIGGGDGEERAPGRMSLPERYEAVGIGVRKRFEEHAVYHAENGGVGPDTKREGEDGDGGESGIPAEATEGVTDVLQKDFERDARSDVAHAILDLFHAAQIAEGFLEGVFRGHAAADVFGCVE